MRPALTLLVLLLLGSGCVGAPSEPPDSQMPAVDALQVPANLVVDGVLVPALDVRVDVLVLPERVDAREPQVAVGPDGDAVYVVVPAGMETRLFHSSDGGESWAARGDVAPPEDGTNEPHMAVGEEGVLWLADMQGGRRGRGAFCTLVALSHDAGETFGPRAEACNGATPIDRPWIATRDGRGYLVQKQMSGRIEFAVSSDGTTWTTTIVPLADGFAGPIGVGGGRIGFLTQRALDSQGDAAAPLRPPLAGVFAYWTSDEGATWTSERVSDDALAYVRWPILALERDGAGLAAWMRQREGASLLTGNTDLISAFGGPADVRVAFLERGGWGEPIILDSTGHNGHVWAGARGGHRVVTWLHSDDGGEWRIRLWRDGVTYELDAIVHRGPLQRQYADYIASDVGVDGRVFVPMSFALEGQTPSLHLFRLEAS